MIRDEYICMCYTFCTLSISWEFLAMNLFRTFSVCCLSKDPIPDPSATGRNWLWIGGTWT